MSSPSTAQDPPPRERRGLAELVRHTLNYGSVPLVHALLAFGMLPFYTEWLSEAQYGVIGLSDLILVVLAELLGQARRDKRLIAEARLFLACGSTGGRPRLFARRLLEPFWLR